MNLLHGLQASKARAKTIYTLLHTTTTYNLYLVCSLVSLVSYV